MIALDRVAARDTYYSYETRTNSIDDGNKLISRLEERKYDSQSPEIIKNKIFVGPSKLNRDARNSWINRQQVRTNLIGGLPERVSGNFNKALDKLSNAFNRRTNAIGNPFRRGFVSRARTVESPALSVDSGGQASSNLAHEMAKLLDVKQGYYADIYNKMDRSNLATKRPADAIEEAMRASVVNLLA